MANRRTLQTRAGRIGILEQGSGPLVLLVHGFPETSYSWRHQLPALADAGYHAVAVDVRGYGRSVKPEIVDDYRMLSLVADVVATVEALGAASVVLVGHDWGSSIASTTALLRPDLVTAVGMLSVPYSPPGGPRPSEAFAAVGGDATFYVRYFSEPGPADRELDADVRGWLSGFYAALSGGTEKGPGVFFIAPGCTMANGFPTTEAPSWLSPDELDVYVEDFERTGFTGALNRYRMLDEDWRDLAAWNGRPLGQPSLFLAGAEDASVTWLADAIDAFPTTLPGLVGSHLLDGCGHWVQQERPSEVNEILLGWLRGLELNR